MVATSMADSADSPDTEDSEDEEGTIEDKELLKRLKQGQARMEQVKGCSLMTSRKYEDF